VRAREAEPEGRAGGAPRRSAPGRAGAGRAMSAPTATDSGRPTLAHLALLALGIVYGDIGTSPLYALRECFHGPYAVEPTPANVLGVLSLVLWSLILIISIKYLVFVLRADNRGEGGMLALTALLGQSPAGRSQWWPWLLRLGLFGAALLCGDGMITPAISVLSAVEGLEVATPIFSPYIVPITIAILVALFAIQRQGTATLGVLFGPVTIVWFAVLAVLGAGAIAREPAVLSAVNPVHGARFFAENGLRGYAVLGLVFLAVTGGEALYADIGHFGARPIRVAWYTVVLPSLLLNYFGQGAYLLGHAQPTVNTFFALAPQWALYPLVALATAATVIASQAVISGVFSVAMQAVQLGYLPRVQITHTSARLFGQIYIAPVNWLLLAATIGLVIGFRSSSSLAAAYGVAITLDMVITSVLLAAVMLRVWKWPLWLVAGLGGLFLSLDLAFFGANVGKIPHGGWFPLAVGAAVFVLMTTWKRGRRLLGERMYAQLLPLNVFVADLAKHPPTRVQGTAVFMTGNVERAPLALAHNIKHNKVVHSRVLLLTVVAPEIPYVQQGERVECRTLGEGLHQVVARYGFMEEPHVPRLLAEELPEELRVDAREVTFFLGRETLLARRRPGMAWWRKRLFVFMSRLASSASTYYHIPADRVIELGAQLEL